MVPRAGGAAQQMQHGGLWKRRVLILLATGLACLPTMAHAEADVMTRVERTSAFDVMLTIGPSQSEVSMAMQPSAPTDTGMSHDAAMGQDKMMPQPQQADQGMAVNHWLDVRVTQADSGLVVRDVTPTI